MRDGKKESLRIGIDASRAFVDEKTGIEEYAYQVIKNLRKPLFGQRVVLYLRPGQAKKIDFKLPKKWETKELFWGRFWTQSGLSLELLFHPVDVLFVPAHTLSFIHPRRSYVTVHGLEFEFLPESYSWQSRFFHRFFIKNSCAWASKVIVVSNKTKSDLITFYKVPEEKVVVIENGFRKRFVGNLKEEGKAKREKFILFIGRLEKRKNVLNIIRSFEVLKGKYGYPGKLYLVGGPGHGYREIKEKIEKSKYRKDIRELGFVSEREKWFYLSEAEIFLFPSLAEGFGIPILEAQSMGVPVVTSDRSPMKDVVADKRVLVNPEDVEEIARVVNRILKDDQLRREIIKAGLDNIKKYSWRRTARRISELLMEKDY